MYELTVRTPGLTWVRVATNANEMTAILQAARQPGCRIEINDKRGARIPFDLASSVALAPVADDLALAA